MQHDVQEFSRILQDKLEIKMKVSTTLLSTLRELTFRAHLRRVPFPNCSRVP